MSQPVQTTDNPLVAIDPNKQFVEEGFPLYLPKNKNRFVQYFPEELVIERTNDFRPTPHKKGKLVQSDVQVLLRAAPEFADLSKQSLNRIFAQDLNTTLQFEKLDPLKGNALAVADYLDSFELCIFGAGPSMSNLVLMVSEIKKFDTVDHSVQLPLDSMYINETINLNYPIRQINISPLSTSTHLVFAVRTTSTIHLFTYDHEGNLSRLHYLNLAEKTTTDPRIDYSMPIHVETSPYNKYEYVYTTNNGYTAVMNAAQNKVLFADIEPIPEGTDYLSRWRSCAFGKSPISIMVATPEHIKEWNYENDIIHTNTLAISNDRIVAFKTCLNGQIYCFATVDSIILMDRKRPQSPAITWLHGMPNALPSSLSIEALSDDKWRIIAFSNETQRASMMEFHYANNPSKSISPTVNVLGLYQMPLPIYHFEDLNDAQSCIQSMGMIYNVRAAENDDTTKGYAMFSFMRLFEDGSIKAQYLALLPNKPETVDNGRFLDKPRLEIGSSLPQFDAMLKKSKKAMLPTAKGLVQSDAEVYSVKMDKFESYIENSIKCGLKTLTDDLKTKISARVRELQVPTTFSELFDNEEYQEFDLEDLTDFLEQMEVHEDIERGRQITIPGVLHHYKPTDQDLNRKLKEAYEKKTQLSKTIIHPLPDHEDIHKFQYLGRQDIQFKSTTTTKVLSSLWSIDDSRFDNLPFLQYDTSTLPRPEEFPSVNIYKRRRSSNPFLSLPIDFETDDQTLETSMPAVVQATPIIPKIKKTKAPSMPTASMHASQNSAASSSQVYASTQLLSPHRPTTPSLTSAFTNVSTQPTEGAFGSRKKSVQKKKKKVKSSGFK